MELPLDDAQQSFTDEHGTEQGITFAAGKPVQARAALSRDPVNAPGDFTAVVSVAGQGENDLLAVRSHGSGGEKIFNSAALATALLAHKDLAHDVQVGDGMGVGLAALLAAGTVLSSLFTDDSAFVLHGAEVLSTGHGAPVGKTLAFTVDYSVAVIAAGNGNANLDQFVRDGRTVLRRGTPDFEDSSAIMVGCCTRRRLTPRSRAPTSAHGSTAAWAENILTTGTPTTPDTKDAFWSSPFFGGTSGASPIITGLCLLIQDLQILLTPKPGRAGRLGPATMRHRCQRRQPRRVEGGGGAVPVLVQERAHSAARPGGGLEMRLGPADPLGLGDRELHSGPAAGKRMRGGFQEQSLGEQQVQVVPPCCGLTAQSRRQARASVEAQPAGSAQLQVDRGGGGQVAALGGQFPGAAQAFCVVERDAQSWPAAQGAVGGAISIQAGAGVVGRNGHRGQRSRGR